MTTLMPSSISFSLGGVQDAKNKALQNKNAGTTTLYTQRTVDINLLVSVSKYQAQFSRTIPSCAINVALVKPIKIPCSTTPGVLLMS